MIWYGGTRLLLETFRSGWNWTILGMPTAMLVGAALIVAGCGADHAPPRSALLIRSPSRIGDRRTTLRRDERVA